MSLRTLSILLVLLSLGFATAPSWIINGTNVNYTSGGNLITFTVTGMSGSDIDVQLTTSSPESKGTITDNASADSGQFWFDPSLLGNAYQGEMLDGLNVMGTSPQTFAGQSWNAVTLQGMISGAQTTKIYDQSTGLLLEQTVDVSGVPNVVLSQYYIQALLPPPPPPPANITPPKNNTAPPPPPQPNVTAPASTPNATQPTTPTQPTTTNYTPPTQPVTPTTTNPAPSNSSSSLCCPTSFIFVLVGFVAMRGFRK